MSDRTLLEMAAKAAGYTCVWRGNDGDFWWHVDPDNARPWNPLTDDGDALRLAVKLGLKEGVVLEIYPRHAQTSWYKPVTDTAYIPHESDPYAATRRAIVRAAAAIGEKIP